MLKRMIDVSIELINQSTYAIHHQKIRKRTTHRILRHDFPWPVIIRYP